MVWVWYSLALVAMGAAGYGVARWQAWRNQEPPPLVPSRHEQAPIGRVECRLVGRDGVQHAVTTAIGSVHPQFVKKHHGHSEPSVYDLVGVVNGIGLYHERG